jgi:3-methyladenine DNA glycosylase AlkD
MKNPGISPESGKIQDELRKAADPEKAVILRRFFKTGPGEYGAGDQFLGVVVPRIRKIVKAHRHADRSQVLKLLHSKFHEERLAALLILVEQYKFGDVAQKKAIFELYLSNTAYINNWDLVDLTAPQIVGGQLFRGDRSILANLALSSNLWERRIAIMATFYFIRAGDGSETFRIAELLLYDPHDLIHKAVGWMLREVGKRCALKSECAFLDRHSSIMPRTMLRYAIERFPPELKAKYMKRSQ